MRGLSVAVVAVEVYNLDNQRIAKPSMTLVPQAITWEECLA